MSEVVRFLEALGEDGSAHVLSMSEYAARVDALELDADQRDALVRRDVDALGRLLRGRQWMACSVFPADEPKREGEDEPEDRPDEGPAEEE